MIRTGGQAVIETLYQEGVRAVFGIPGVHNLAMYDALTQFDDLRHYVTRHEQGAGFIADGYARASGEIGVVLVTTGPGALNTLTPMQEAFGASSPLLVISSQVPAKYIGKQKGILHEVDDQFAMFKPVSGQQRFIDSVEAIPEAIHDVLHGMRSGRPRPAYVEIPYDVLNAQAETDLGRPQAVERRAASDADVQAIAEALASAERPLIVYGGGVTASGGAAELRQLLDVAPAAAASSMNGRGAIPEDHPLALGHLINISPVKEFVESRDFVLALGAKFSDRSTNNWTTQYSKNLIHVNIDASEFNKNYPCRLGVQADAVTVIRQVREALADKQVRADRAVQAEIAQLKAQAHANVREDHHDVAFALDQLRGALPRDSRLVVDMTLLGYWCRTHYEVYEPRTLMQAIGSGTLGFALPCAIGAKIAQPEQPIYALVGDGGFFFTIQEYATAVRYGLDVPIILFNDNKYGAIEWIQSRVYDRVVDAELANPDFMKFAESFGIDGVRIASLNELPGAIRFASRKPGPVIIEVQVSLEPPWKPERFKQQRRVTS